MATQRAAHSDVAVETWRQPMGLWRAIATVRRLEFYVVELTIFSIPLLVASNGVRDLLQPAVAEGLLMFFVLYSVGDMVNCLADRELDKAYKTRLSRAVFRIGVRRLGWLVAIQAVLGLGLAIHLSVGTGRWLILLLVVIGLFLGLGYSLKPFHFKARGLAQFGCLWALLYFLPMVCASLLVSGPSVEVLTVAALYATVEMGIILVNTSEDFVEDRAAGVRTTAVALGLPTTLALATVMVVLGGAGFCGFWLHSFVGAGVGVLGYLVLAGLTLVCGAIAIRLVWLTRRVVAVGDQLDSAVLLVKAHGHLVPIAATAVGWFGVACALILASNGGN